MHVLIPSHSPQSNLTFSSTGPFPTYGTFMPSTSAETSALKRSTRSGK